ncbi:MAG: hypothetical protein ACR2RF_06030 [Geminicoccaceae bacterium]
MHDFDDEPMMFDDWLEEQKQTLLHFERMWRDESRKDADRYPMEMPAGKWDEQYRAYTEV